MSNLQTAAKPTLAYVALALGALGIIAGIFVPLAGWVLGLAALVTGFLSFRQPALAKLGQIAMVLGFVAILVGVFFFTNAIA
ncbi:hypothetical protein ACLFMI_13515 [Pseudonocardia nantongensis]|uniref:hypothetical protein n=1 Tax=Pseudonocardia nantongensis TaxID=1181885 RepID=UPI003978E5F4